MNKKLKFLIPSFLITGLIFNSSVTTFANDFDKNEQTVKENSINIISTKEKEILNNWLKSYDVDEATRINLISKLERGELWDSVSSKKPISSENLNSTTIKNTYEDGSISVQEIEDINSENSNLLTDNNFSSGINYSNDVNIVPFAISGGSVSSGSGYSNHKNVKVHNSTGLISASFYADYTIVRGGYDYISNVYNPRATVIAGTVSGVNLRIENKKEGTYKAKATLSFDVTSLMGISGSHCYLNLYVGGDRATSDYAF